MLGNSPLLLEVKSVPRATALTVKGKGACDKDCLLQGLRAQLPAAVDVWG